MEGQLTIASHVLRSTVARRYLRDSAMQTLVHQDLVRYFQQPLDDISETRRMQVLAHASGTVECCPPAYCRPLLVNFGLPQLSGR